MFSGYSVGIRGRRVHVRIADRACAELRPVPKQAVWLKRRYVRPFDLGEPVLPSHR